MRKILTVCLILGCSLGFAPTPVKPVKPVKPEDRLQVKFTGLVTQDGHKWLCFEASNSTDKPIPYLGYTSDSFSGGLKEGTIAPIYQVQESDGKTWKPKQMGFCGTGIGPVSIPAKGKGTFRILMLDGSWKELKVGVAWSESKDRKGIRGVAWSQPISRTVIGQ